MLGLLVLHSAQRLPAFVDRPVRDGYSLKKLTQHFVLGYFHSFPPGQKSSPYNPSPSVDAHGRLPDRLRIGSDMRRPHALPAAHFERNHIAGYI
jgi:hypothetical protein